MESMAPVDFLNKPEVFPINTGDHWVSLVLYKDESDHKVKCVVFNSFSELNKGIKISLADSAKIAGLSEEENIEFIDGNMQRNVPNGCGIFVIKAIDLLSHAPEENPVNTLKAFTDDFAKVQLTFYQNTRRFLAAINDIPETPLHYVADQLDADVSGLQEYDWPGRDIVGKSLIS